MRRGIKMSMFDLSEIIPFDFIIKLVFGAILFIIDFRTVPYLIEELTESYRSLSARAGYLVLIVGLIVIPFSLWYNAYVNSPFYGIYPLDFVGFCIRLIIGVPVLILFMCWYEMSNRG